MTWPNSNEAWSAEQAAIIAGWFWIVLMMVWIVMRFTIKKAKKRETFWEFLQHAAPAILGFWLIFEKAWKWHPLEQKLLPDVPLVWNIGLLLTGMGVAIAIWARFSLGRNWSGVVTLKDDHELVGSGPYRWIRHPIYTGLLMASLGSAMIKGHLRGWIGFLVILVMFYYKARREEQFLRQEFGSGFEEHTRRTGMFLPKWT
jgi:protein-S-isoprenylcysteine O-methyltransferase Ste14